MAHYVNYEAQLETKFDELIRQMADQKDPVFSKYAKIVIRYLNKIKPILVAKHDAKETIDAIKISLDNTIDTNQQVELALKRGEQEDRLRFLCLTIDSINIKLKNAAQKFFKKHPTYDFSPEKALIEQLYKA